MALCLATATALAGCHRADRVRASGSAGSRITIAIPSADAPTSPLVASLTQTRLLRMDQAGHERPALIERWSVSADDRTWTFAIRPGVRFQDGREAAAADVALLLQQAVAAGGSRPGLSSVAAIDPVGSREVRVRLREPTSLLLESLTLVRALDAGPYRTSDPEAQLPELRAVPQANQPVPGIQTVSLRRYRTPRAAVAALLRDDVDVLYELPNEARALLASEDGVRIYPHLKPYVVTLGINHRHPVLARRNVRLAMNALVDRAALVAHEAGGTGVPAADIIWLQHWSRPHTADAEAMRVDRDRARRLLDAAGLRARRGRDGSVPPRFRIRCLVLEEPTITRVARRLQHVYADAGIALDLETLPLNALLPRLAAGEFETFLSPVVSGFGLSLPYLHFGAHDSARVIDDGYTAAMPALERVRRATRDDAFANAVGDLHRVLLEDPPAVYLYWQQTNRAIGRRIELPGDADGDVLASLPRWTVGEAAR